LVVVVIVVGAIVLSGARFIAHIDIALALALALARTSIDGSLGYRSAIALDSVWCKWFIVGTRSRPKLASTKRWV
jgi:hypothetical protein